MSKIPFYTVRIQTGEYLQGIDINDNYSRSGTAPTLGVRHSFCEFKTIWGMKPKAFDYRTLSGYINVLLNEYQWDERIVYPFVIIPSDENGKEIGV